MIVDIDEDSLESPYTEDLNTIPADIIANLKRILKKPSSGYGDNLARAFLLAQVAMLGGYRSSLKQKQVQERGRGVCVHVYNLCSRVRVSVCMCVQPVFKSEGVCVHVCATCVQE